MLFFTSTIQRHATLCFRNHEIEDLLQSWMMPEEERPVAQEREMSHKYEAGLILL